MLPSSEFDTDATNSGQSGRVSHVVALGCGDTGLKCASVRLHFVDANYTEADPEIRKEDMPTISSKADRAQLFYRDYSPSTKAPAFKPAENRNVTGKPILVFAAAWPFSSKMYDHIMLPLCESYGFRCIAIDRRGYGGSQWSGPSKPGQDINFDMFADDLALMLETKGVSDEDGFVGIGASLGCGEFLLALHRHPELQAACRGLVFLGPSLPIPLQTSRKSTGPPRSFWDSLLGRLRNDRYEALTHSLPYIFGEEGTKMLSSFEVRRYEDIAMSADPFALERTVQIFLARDFTDLIEERRFKFPLLILHGDADAANPVESGPGLIQANWPNAKVLVYERAAHAIAATHKERCLDDISKFLETI